MSVLITTGRYEGLLAKGGNASGVGGAVGTPGVVVTTAAAAGDLLHTVPLNRSFYVTKIMWYNPGVPATLTFGTLSNALVPAAIAMFPLQVALAGLNGEMLEEDLAGQEFMLNSVPLLGWDGSLYVVASIALIQVSVEVAEKG